MDTEFGEDVLDVVADSGVAETKFIRDTPECFIGSQQINYLSFPSRQSRLWTLR